MADINSSLPVTDTSDGTPGASAPALATQVAGSDGTNLRTIKTDAAGQVYTIGRAELANYSAIGQGYVTSVSGMTVSAAETPAYYITNPNGSGKTIYIAYGLMNGSPNDAGNWIQFNLYFDPTISVNGTVAAIINRLPSSANSSIASAFTKPTATSNGTLVDIWVDGGANTASADKIAWDPRGYIIIPPNHKLMITTTAKANNTPVIILLQWFEA